jgi:hypothetical protein
MSPIPVITENVTSEAPLPGQGDIAASPRPEDSANRIRETAAATTAPAVIAPQDTAEVEAATVGASRVASGNPVSVASRSIK